MKFNEIKIQVQEVEVLCKTPTGGTGGTTHLSEWLEEGDFDGNETASGLAAEWDKLSA